MIDIIQLIQYIGINAFNYGIAFAAVVYGIKKIKEKVKSWKSMEKKKQSQAW